MSVIILFCLSFLLVEYISWHFKGEKVQKNTQIVMCFLLLFIFFGFRDLPILNDTAHYYRHVRHLFSNTPFDNTPWYTFDSFSNFEEGFQIFLRIIGLVISKEPYSLIIITSFITTASLLWFLNKSTSHVAFAVFVLMTSTLLLGCYSAIRQSLAVSVSYIFYWRNCWIHYSYLRACCFIIFTATSIKKRLKKDKLYVSFALSALIVNIWALPCFSPFPLRYVLLAICGCTLYKQPVSGGSGQAIENIKICGCRDIGFANTHCLDL